MTPRPVVYINITRGVEQWTITAPGNGEPEVYIVDHDDEGSIDDYDYLLQTQTLALASLRGRIPPEVEATLEQGIVGTKDRITDLVNDGAVRYFA